MTTNMMGQVYESLLCSPGMNEAVKVDVRIVRTYATKVRREYNSAWLKGAIVI